MNHSWKGKTPFKAGRSALVITLLFCGLLSSPLSPGSASGIDGRGVKVLDGDTIRVTLKSGKIETVRFLGIDAPESYIMRFGYSEFLGREAFREVRGLLQGKPVLLKTRGTGEALERDRHGRILAFVNQGTIDVCSHLVKLGLARVYRKSPSPRHDELLGYEAAAKEKKLGIWDTDAERKYYRSQFKSGGNRYLVLWFWENDRDFLRELLCP